MADKTVQEKMLAEERKLKVAEKVAKAKEAANFAAVGIAAEFQDARIDSATFNPLATVKNSYAGGISTVSPVQSRRVHAKTLRKVGEKAWIINLCVSNVIRKIRPYLKKATGENLRGWRIRCAAAIDEGREPTEEESEEMKAAAKFLQTAGGDSFDDYCVKITRDILQLDQAACELRLTRGGEVCGFFAVDAATIEIATPECERETGAAFVQVIDGRPCAAFSRGDFIFDCANPRTDVDRAGYGYSVVEQAIDLITSQIQTFAYNAGFFTENRLPRGFLSLSGDADMATIEEFEDHIIDVMSGDAQSLWRVPIIPSGGDGKELKWISLDRSANKDMEFQSWLDLQLSAIAAMFGFSLEDLGLHSSHSQSMFAENTAPKIEASKSLVLGDTLGFLQKHVNKILERRDPRYLMEFVGYERDDPKSTLDIDKGEMESYKTMNEKRAEKGLEPLDFAATKNPADLPMNPHAISAWQASQGGGEEGGFGGYGFDDGEGDEVRKSLGSGRVVRIVV